MLLEINIDKNKTSSTSTNNCTPEMVYPKRWDAYMYPRYLSPLQADWHLEGKSAGLLSSLAGLGVEFDAGNAGRILTGSDEPLAVRVDSHVADVLSVTVEDIEVLQLAGSSVDAVKDHGAGALEDGIEAVRDVDVLAVGGEDDFTSGGSLAIVIFGEGGDDLDLSEFGGVAGKFDLVRSDGVGEFADDIVELGLALSWVEDSVAGAGASWDTDGFHLNDVGLCGIIGKETDQVRAQVGDGDEFASWVPEGLMWVGCFLAVGDSPGPVELEGDIPNEGYASIGSVGVVY